MSDEHDDHDDDDGERRVTDGKAEAAFSISVLAAGLCVIAVVVTVFVAVTVLKNRDDVHLSVCAIVTYAESQADQARAGDPSAKPPRPPNPKAADNLDDLSRRVRKTGINCPARVHDG